MDVPRELRNILDGDTNLFRRADPLPPGIKLPSVGGVDPATLRLIRHPLIPRGHALAFREFILIPAALSPTSREGAELIALAVQGGSAKTVDALKFVKSRTA